MEEDIWGKSQKDIKEQEQSTTNESAQKINESSNSVQAVEQTTAANTTVQEQPSNSQIQTTEIKPIQQQPVYRSGEQKPHYDMPATLAFSTTMQRVGVILSNYAILGTILALSSFAFFLFYALYYVTLALIALCTLGIVFLAVPNFSSAFDAEILDTISVGIGAALPYICIGTIACAVLSLIFLFANKQNRSMPRIIFSFVVVAFVAILLIASLTSKGGAA